MQFANAHAKRFPEINFFNIRVDWARLALNFIKNQGGSAYLARQMLGKSLKTKKLHIVEDAPSINREFYAVFKIQSPKADVLQQLISQIRT